MLQALIHKKLKASFTDPHFRPSEDTLTASVLGRFQYLPDNEVATIFRNAFGLSTSFPESIGQILDYQFWTHWDATNTDNSNFVEPEVWIETSDYNIIVEAKKFDGGGQYEDQWRNEIQSFMDTFPLDKRLIIFIAIGGNTSLTERTILVKENRYNIYPISWFNLLHAVTTLLSQTEVPHQQRILRDIIEAFEHHNYFDVTWLVSLPMIDLNSNVISSFESISLLPVCDLYTPINKLNSKQTIKWLG